MKLRASLSLLAIALLTGCGSSGTAQPAATVNGHTISMAEYHTEFHVERVQEFDRVGYDVCQLKGLAAACALIKQRSLNTIINRELIREYATKHGITVTAAEDQRNWVAVFKTRFDNQRAVLRAFLKRTGETEEALRTSLRDDLLQNKVMAVVTKNMPLVVPGIRVAHFVAASKRELRAIRTMVASGEPVKQITKTLTASSPKGCKQPSANCGDLGWAPLAFVPPNRRQIATTPVGHLAGPFREQLATATLYEVYLVEARDPSYPMTLQQIYTMRQQVFQQWLQRQRAQSRVKRFVAV